MSDDFSLVKLEDDNFFTQKDEELVKKQLVNLRAEGSRENAKGLAKQLRSSLPSISEDTILQIEGSSGYVNQVMQTQMGKIAGHLSGIVDALLEKSLKGDTKAIPLLMELSGLTKSKTIGTQNNTLINQNLKVLNDDELIGRSGKLARYLDS